MDKKRISKDDTINCCNWNEGNEENNSKARQDRLREENKSYILDEDI